MIFPYFLFFLDSEIPLSFSPKEGTIFFLFYTKFYTKYVQ